MFIRYASLATFLLIFATHAKAQESNQLTFCDTQDEITAVAVYGEEAVPIINRTFKDGCVTLYATYARGKTVETVWAFDKLWDITPVLVYEAHGRNIPPMEQWVALTSPLVEVSFHRRY